MTKITSSIAICLVFLFLLSSCSTTKNVVKRPEFKVTKITLAKDVKEKEGTFIPVSAATTFEADDRQIVAHIELENLSGTHTLRWDWYDPNGQLYYSTGDYPLTVEGPNYLPESATWHKISVRGDKAADRPGKWALHLFFDDALIKTQTFAINAFKDGLLLPDSANLTPIPDNWGLIIGIEDYANLPNVDYARKDAQIMKDYFIKILGIPEENIIFLLDSQATKARIQGYLHQYIPKNVSLKTNLYVYFAGHGAPDLKNGSPYIIPYDGDTRFLEQTGYNLGTFYKDLDNINVNKSYVFLDSCFSGVASRAVDMLIKGARPALIKIDHSKFQYDKDKIITITATSSGEISNAFHEKRHGLFTFYFLEGLSGRADEDKDKKISIKELFTYVKKQVNVASRRIGIEQTPTISPSLEVLENFIFSQKYL